MIPVKEWATPIPMGPQEDCEVYVVTTTYSISMFLGTNIGAV